MRILLNISLSCVIDRSHCCCACIDNVLSNALNAKKRLRCALYSPAMMSSTANNSDISLNPPGDLSRTSSLSSRTRHNTTSSTTSTPSTPIPSSPTTSTIHQVFTSLSKSLDSASAQAFRSNVHDMPVTLQLPSLRLDTVSMDSIHSTLSFESVDEV
jgi:hypothetical protein